MSPAQVTGLFFMFARFSRKGDTEMGEGLETEADEDSDDCASNNSFLESAEVGLRAYRFL
eukprot:c8547_g1_i1 orf=212-391(+)